MRRPLQVAEADAVMGIALNSRRWVRRSAEDEAFDEGAQRQALAWSDAFDPDFESGQGWASYAHPNPSRHLLAALEAGAVTAGDVVLDLGAGDARLSLLAILAFGASRAIAIEADGEWVAETQQFISRFGTNGYISDAWSKVRYISGPWQQRGPFDSEITVAFFIAWHCGPRMRAAVLEALQPTSCRVLVDNFGVREYRRPEQFHVTEIDR